MGEPDKATREALAEAHRKSVKVVGRIAMTPTPPRDRLAEIERALEPFARRAAKAALASPYTEGASLSAAFGDITIGDLRAASAVRFARAAASPKMASIISVCLLTCVPAYSSPNNPRISNTRPAMAITSLSVSLLSNRRTLDTDLRSMTSSIAPKITAHSAQSSNDCQKSRDAEADAIATAVSASIKAHHRHAITQAALTAVAALIFAFLLLARLFKW